MSQPIIAVRGLSKRYRLGRLGASSLRQEAERLFGGGSGATVEDFWALKDVSFDVGRGEVLGVIGANGAGKSTLLKLLSRVTAPTTGEIRLRGRVASLLEVGTGFHPELTGRENIFLNGAILGMTRAEIRGKFDQIVEFSGVAPFLDTPVKRYSSGMYVRLAFAVAAHLEPDILIVDEVLAVGDAAFQEKCIGRMQADSRRGGRTVIFVTHNMAALQTLCPHSIVLESGQIAFRGETRQAIQFYQRDRLRAAEVHDSGRWLHDGAGGARILSIRLEDDAGRAKADFDMGDARNIIVRAQFERPERNPVFGVDIATDDGVLVANCRSTHDGVQVGVADGVLEYRLRIEALPLYPRVYSVQPWIMDQACLTWFDWVRNGAEFEVLSGARFLNGAKVSAQDGITFIPSAWSVNRAPQLAAAPAE
jgi:lipopolysaccharide transport system ATP-binding protein